MTDSVRKEEKGIEKIQLYYYVNRKEKSGKNISNQLSIFTNDLISCKGMKVSFGIEICKVEQFAILDNFLDRNSIFYPLIISSDSS